MPQVRLYNYGATATSRWENLSLYATQIKGVYRGMDLSLDSSGNLITEAGYLAVPSAVNGASLLVVVWESTPVGYSFVPPSLPTSYTLVGFHENREILGGVEVQYEIREGVFADVSDGTVLGWIFHPGGSGVLTQDMLLSAPKVMSQEYATDAVIRKPLEIVAPFGSRSYFETIGPDVTITDPSWDAAKFIIHQLAENSPTAPGQQLARQMVQFYVDSSVRPSSFSLYVNIDASPQTYLAAEVYGTDQAPVTTTGSPFYGSGTGNWEWLTLEVDRTDGAFVSGLPYTLRLTHNLAVGGRIRLAAIKANFWPYPV